MRFVDPSGLAAEDGGGGCDAICQTIIFVATVIAGVLFGGGGEPNPRVPPGPIHPTDFDALQAPQLPTSFPGVAALPPVGATSIAPLTEAGLAPLEPFPKPYGFVDELSDVFSGVSTAQLFFSAPMLRALSWAGRTGQGLLLSERGAVQIGRATARGVAEGAVDAAAGQSSKTVVIGETMDRVKAYARSIGAKWYQAWKIKPYDKTLALKRNERWIRSVIRKGYKIIDRGIDKARFIRSEAYALEKRIIKALKYPVVKR